MAWCYSMDSYRSRHHLWPRSYPVGYSSNGRRRSDRWQFYHFPCSIRCSRYHKWCADCWQFCSEHVPVRRASRDYRCPSDWQFYCEHGSCFSSGSHIRCSNCWKLYPDPHPCWYSGRNYRCPIHYFAHTCNLCFCRCND